MYLPPEPLMALLKDKSLTEAAELLGCNSNTIHHYRTNRYRIHYAKADEYAVALGYHPAAVWGKEWQAPATPRLKKSGPASN